MFKHTKAILLSALLIFTITGCSNNDAVSESSLQASNTPRQSKDAVVSTASETSSSQTVPSETESSQAMSGETESSQAMPSETGSSQTMSSEAEASTPEASSSAVASTEVSGTPIAEAATATTAGELTVHFGDDGAPFTMHLYDNSTAAAIADYVGTADWRLPIYNYDGYDNWEVMQYYDLPSRYEIPSNVETVTTQKTGEVFYSDPNRIVLFYGDGEVTGEYSRVGYFEATADFISAVQNNPVLEGWGNKIVLIKE